MNNLIEYNEVFDIYNCLYFIIIKDYYFTYIQKKGNLDYRANN